MLFVTLAGALHFAFEMGACKDALGSPYSTAELRTHVYGSGQETRPLAGAHEFFVANWIG